MAPFGSGSLATADAEIQYIDFFAYFKDLLCGKNSIFYTFSDTLGGDTLGIFSYYLASPFNLLMAFFPKSEILVFFNLIVALKISMCALTTGIFLRCRFDGRLKPVYEILLSLCYAFMQYNLAQADNIMWLDGAYMLPLILLGVYKAVNHRNVILLSVSAGLCIIFNWYAAGMCCLLSIVWFFFEFVLKCLDGNGGKFSFKDFLLSITLYGGSMIAALMLSAVLFLPTVASMLGGKGIDPIYVNEFTGNILNSVGSWRLGAQSSLGNPALFCGSVVLIGAVSFFFAKGISRKHKLLFGALIFFMMMTVYWQPMFMVFSLFRSIGSYWYRHAFLIIFALVFTAAYFFACDIPARTKYMLASASAFCAVTFMINYTAPSDMLKYVYYTAAATAITAVLLSAIPARRIFSVSAVLFLLIELGFNAYHIIICSGGTEYKEETVLYQTEQQKQIDEIKQKDSGFYRIAQAKLRMGAAYNDSLAYGFASNCGYTSCPDNLQLRFLENLGYREEGECITAVYDPIIAADALLGVKYILSDYEIGGLVPAKGILGYNGNTVYENPYCLPMTYTVDSFEDTEYTLGNPFEFQNEIYSQLVGEETEIYKKLDYIKTDKEDGFCYDLNIPKGNYVLYGNMPFAEIPGVIASENTHIILDSAKSIKYANWLSASVFYIPVDGDNHTEVNVVTDRKWIFNDGETAQFYALDLDKLKIVCESINENAVDTVTYDRGRMSGGIISESGGYAVLPLPVSDNWSFKINGQTVQPMDLGNGLTVLPLIPGNNDIEGVYTIPGLFWGIILSVLGIFVIIAAAFVTYNKKIRDMLLKTVNSRAVRYIAAGGATTLVNLVVFTLLCRVLHLEVNLSNVISVVCAILFAYVVNKIFVFESRCPSFSALAAEFVKFVGARGVTMIVEVGGVFLLYNIIGQNELIAKLETQIIVLTANYIISKFLVFKSSAKES